MYNPYWNFIYPRRYPMQEYRRSLREEREIYKGVPKDNKFRCYNIGDKAPSFTLDAVVGGKESEVSLDDYLGQWIVLFFYGSDFTFV